MRVEDYSMGVSGLLNRDVFVDHVLADESWVSLERVAMASSHRGNETHDISPS